MKNMVLTKISVFIISILMTQSCSNAITENQDARQTERDLIISTVPQPERAEKLLSLVDRRDELEEQQKAIISDFEIEVKALNRNYATSRESFDKAIALFNEQRLSQQHQFLELITEMKKETTSDEWKLISTYQQKNLRLRELAYKQNQGDT